MEIVKNGPQAFAEVKNASPYFVTVNEGFLNANGRKYEIEKKMIAPDSTQLMKVDGLTTPVSTGKINYTAINDYGGNIKHEASL